MGLFNKVVYFLFVFSVVCNIFSVYKMMRLYGADSAMSFTDSYTSNFRYVAVPVIRDAVDGILSYQPSGVIDDDYNRLMEMLVKLGNFVRIIP